MVREVGVGKPQHMPPSSCVTQRRSTVTGASAGNTSACHHMKPVVGLPSSSTVTFCPTCRLTGTGASAAFCARTGTTTRAAIRNEPSVFMAILLPVFVLYVNSRPQNPIQQIWRRYGADMAQISQIVRFIQQKHPFYVASSSLTLHNLRFYERSTSTLNRPPTHTYLSS